MPKPDIHIESDGDAKTATKAMFRVFISAPPEDVWAEITRTDKTIPAFFGTRMDAPSLTPGSRIAMRTKNGKYTGVVGDIIEIDPPRVLAMTFKFTNFDDPPCIVRHELTPKDNGTVFTMTLTELPVGTKTAKQMMQGGKFICAVLKSVVESGKPAFGHRMLLTLFRVFEPLSPKQTRSEHWPAGEGAASS